MNNVDSRNELDGGTSDRPTWQVFLASAALTVAALASVNSWISWTSPPVSHLLRGVFSRYQYRHGAVAYVVGGQGPPVLLVHGLGAGNSMAEWGANFAALSANHTVYAVDLPGWGLSDKSHHSGTAEECIECICYFAADIIGEPCALVASADACCFAIRAAEQSPEIFARLVLICPSLHDEEVGNESISHGIQKIIDLPILGRTFINLITSRSAIKRFCESQLFFDKSMVSDRLVSEYYAAAHTSGAEHAIAALVSGNYAINVRESWSRLDQPVLLVWGRNSRINAIEVAPEWLALKPDAELKVIDCAMLLPHAEHPAEFNHLALDWLK